MSPSVSSPSSVFFDDFFNRRRDADLDLKVVFDCCCGDEDVDETLRGQMRDSVPLKVAPFPQKWRR